MELRDTIAQSGILHPGPGAGLPSMIADILLGRNGERAEAFLAQNPETDKIVHRILHPPDTKSGRVQACHARQRLAALYCPLPGTRHYFDRYYAPPPQRVCNWCQELWQPKRGSGYGNQIYCSRACNQRRYQFFRRERERASKHGPAMPKDVADRYHASVDRYCRRESAKHQARLGLPDW